MLPTLGALMGQIDPGPSHPGPYARNDSRNLSTLKDPIFDFIYAGSPADPPRFYDPRFTPQYNPMLHRPDGGYPAGWRGMEDFVTGR